jgi:hypothetical protein
VAERLHRKQQLADAFRAGDKPVNQAGFAIHSQVHAAR